MICAPFRTARYAIAYLLILATFIAEPLITLLLTSLHHWLLGYSATAVAGREPARVAAVVFVGGIAVVDVLPRLRLLARAAPRGLDLLLALVPLAIPKSIWGKLDVESVV
jgi:hypothetical protein